MTVSAAERAAFAADGFIVRPGAVAEETCAALCAQLSEIIAREAAARCAEAAPTLEFFEIFRRSAHRASVMWDLSRGGPAGLPPSEWERFAMRVGHGLHLVDERFRAAALAPGVGDVLATLIGGRAAIAQTAVVYKQPESEAVQFGLHQDAWYLTTEPESLVLAFIALDDMDLTRGCLEVVPGSHREGLLARLMLTPGGFVAVGRDPYVADLKTVPLVMRRGDVAFVARSSTASTRPSRGPRPPAPWASTPTRCPATCCATRW